MPLGGKVSEAVWLRPYPSFKPLIQNIMPSFVIPNKPRLKACLLSLSIVYLTCDRDRKLVVELKKEEDLFKLGIDYITFLNTPKTFEELEQEPK
jgi:hypothetical protein